MFKELLVKPLKIQMVLEFPELADDELFSSFIRIDFNSNDLFEEWKYLQNLAKRSEIASNLSTNLQDAAGQPYLSIEWIVRHVMKFSDADIAENDRYKLRSGAAGAGGGAAAPGGEGGPPPGGGPEMGGGEFGGGGAEEFGGAGPEMGAQPGAQGGAQMGGAQGAQGGAQMGGGAQGGAPQAQF
jgi:hypothetical protein